MPLYIFHTDIRTSIIWSVNLMRNICPYWDPLHLIGKSVWDITESSSKTLVETYEITGVFFIGETTENHQTFPFAFHGCLIQSPIFHTITMIFSRFCNLYLWLVHYICIRESLTQEESTLSQDISSCSKNLIKQTHAHIRESRADWTPVLLAFDLNFSSPSKHAHF